MSAFLIWGHDPLHATRPAHLGSVSHPDVKRSELRRGTKLQAVWSRGSVNLTGACDGLPDSFSSPFIVSRRVRDWLSGQALADVELLPVNVVNTKAEVVSGDFFYVRPPMIDCVDLEMSHATINTIDNWSVQAAKGLVLREGAVPPTVSLFRPERLPSTVVIRVALADALRAQGFSGVSLETLESFDGFQAQSVYRASDHGHRATALAKKAPPKAKGPPAIAKYLEKTLKSPEDAAELFDHEPARLTVRFFEPEPLKAWLLDAYADELTQLGCAEDGEWSDEQTVPLAAVAGPNTKGKTLSAFMTNAIGWVFFDGTLFVTTTDRWDRDTVLDGLDALIGD